MVILCTGIGLESIFLDLFDSNTEEYQCSHAIYSCETNQVLFDFWCMYEQRVSEELILCHCKHSVSCICVIISHYASNDINKENIDILSKLLLNEVEILVYMNAGILMMY